MRSALKSSSHSHVMHAAVSAPSRAPRGKLAELGSSTWLLDKASGACNASMHAAKLIATIKLKADVGNG